MKWLNSQWEQTKAYFNLNNRSQYFPPVLVLLVLTIVLLIGRIHFLP